MADLHPGQFIDVGAEITTLQGVDDAIHIDFAVTQQVVAGLREGDAVEVIASGPTGAAPIQAKIIAIDSRISHSTRNAMVRARVEGEAAKSAPGPGASVRVRVPAGPPRTAVAVSVSALRKGPAGDHVFVIAPDSAGKPRAQLRPVRSGAMLGDVVLIYDGLKPGEQIAESGSFKLRDGVLVAAAPNDAAPAANPGM